MDYAYGAFGAVDDVSEQTTWLDAWAPAVRNWFSGSSGAPELSASRGLSSGSGGVEMGQITELPGSSEPLLGGFDEDEKMFEADEFLEEMKVDLDLGEVSNTGNVMRASVFDEVPPDWEASLVEREAAFDAEMVAMEERVVSLAPVLEEVAEGALASEASASGHLGGYPGRHRSW